VQKRDGPPLSPCQVWRGSWVARRLQMKKSDVCFFCSFFVCILSRFGITETQWSSVIFKTVIVPLHRGRFLVVHLYSSFSMDPLDFFLGANLYKNCYFLRFWRPYGHIFKATKVHFSVIVGTWETLPTPNFVKIAEGDIPSWGKYIPKITNFSDFSGCKPTFIKPKR